MDKKEENLSKESEVGVEKLVSPKFCEYLDELHDEIYKKHCDYIGKPLSEKSCKLYFEERK